MPDTVVVTPAIELSVVFDPNGGRAFQTRVAPLPLDTSRADLDAALDLVLEAVDRQIARYELMDSMARLKEQVVRLEKYEGLIVSLEERHRVEWELKGKHGEWSIDKLPPAAANARETTKINLQKERAEADALQDRVHRLRSMVNGDASDSRANSQSG